MYSKLYSKTKEDTTICFLEKVKRFRTVSLGMEVNMAKIVQTAGRKALGEFAPEFAHFNDDVLFGENWNNEDIDVKMSFLYNTSIRNSKKEG